MPGTIQFLGRKWPIASDDLVLGGAAGILFRILFLLGTIALLIVCGIYRGTALQLAFLAVSLGLHLISLVCYAELFNASRSGTMLDFGPRTLRVERAVGRLTIVYIVEVGVLGLGIASLVTVRPFNVLLARNLSSLIGVLALSLDILALLFIFVYMQYVRGASLRQVYRSPRELRMIYERRVRVVFSALAFVTCGFFGSVAAPGGSGEVAWQQAGDIIRVGWHDFAEDLTLSDVLAGIVLLRIAQKEEKERAVAEMLKRVTSSLSLTPMNLYIPDSVKSGVIASSVPALTAMNHLWTGAASMSSPESGGLATSDEISQTARAIRLGAKYMPYAIAMYGYKLEALRSPLSLVLSQPWIVARYYCAGWLKKDYGSHVDVQVFKKIVPEAELLYSSFTSYMAEAVPYTISLDRTRKAVIISMRGTMSWGDAVTDLMLVPESLRVPGEMWGFDGSKHYAHGGVLRVAMRLRQDIEQRKILHKLFPAEARGSSPTTSQHTYEYVTEEDRASFNAILNGRNNLGSAETGMFLSTAFVGSNDISPVASDYEIIVTGHSLGASMASVLTLLLRPAFPKARCIAYAPGGYTFSKELADASSAWCDTPFVDKDFAPRFSWHEIKRIRGRVLDLITRTKASKSDIFLALARGTPLSQLVHDSHDDSYPDYDASIRVKLRERLARLNEGGNGLLDSVPLYPPGRLVHFVRTHHFNAPKKHDTKSAKRRVRDDEEMDAYHTIPDGPARNGVRHMLLGGGLCGLLPNRMVVYMPYYIRDRTEVKDTHLSPRLLADHIPNLLGDILDQTVATMNSASTKQSLAIPEP